MAAQSFFYSSNCPPPFHHHTTTVPPPPDLLPFHHNFTFSDHNPFLFNNGVTNTNLHFQNTINYPTLSSSSYNPPITHQQLLPPPLPDLSQSLINYTDEYHSNPIIPNTCDNGDFFPVMNSEDPMQLSDCYSYPVVSDQYLCSMEPELLPPMPEVYNGGGSSGVMYGGGVVQMKENGRERLSAQSMAARVRRRKISEKTSELGKLVPGGQKMTTAEMFQAAYKYIKFLQAQVGVLQRMSSSPGLGSELQALLTCPSVQEKLYAAGKCIVSQTLGEALADDHQPAKN